MLAMFRPRCWLLASLLVCGGLLAVSFGSLDFALHNGQHVLRPRASRNMQLKSVPYIPHDAGLAAQHVPSCAMVRVMLLMGLVLAGASRATMTGKSAHAVFWVHGAKTRIVGCQAESTDAVTGTKFEEEDEKKNPSRRPGHQVRGMGEVDPDTAAKQAQIREHQEKCPRLTWPEEIRTIMAQPKGFAVLSTLSRKGETAGFPVGSIVGFATDEQGRPIFSFSGMSAHTGNVLSDSRASLCVTEPNFCGAADARVVLTGRVAPVPKSEQDVAQEKYLEKHAGAYWVRFGDFTMFRMEVLDISFVGGFARAGGISVEEYSAAAVDPCSAFAEGVMKHMNDDHEDSIKGYVEYLVGTGPCESAKMKRIDRFGFDVRIKQGGNEGVLRVPFATPVIERQQIKSAIMELSKQVAALKA